MIIPNLTKRIERLRFLAFIDDEIHRESHKEN